MSRIDVLDLGYVELCEVMGDDSTAPRCARTSFNNRNADATPESDERLMKYLLRHRHTTPFEFSQLRLYIKAPMYVGEQILRHRTASVNKVSYRYVGARPEFYVPSTHRMQKAPKKNKQGSSDELVEVPKYCQAIMRDAHSIAYEIYERLLRQELAPEIARGVLPMNTYTEWYWQIDLHNFMHFCDLRLEEHAQWETKQYATAMFELASAKFPLTLRFWKELWDERQIQSKREAQAGGALGNGTTSKLTEADIDRLVHISLASLPRALEDPYLR